MERKYENDEMQIDLIEIFYVLKSKILAILGVGLLFGVLACAYAAFMVKPVYTSTSMVLVMPKEVSLSSSLQLGEISANISFRLSCSRLSDLLKTKLQSRI